MKENLDSILAEYADSPMKEETKRAASIPTTTNKVERKPTEKPAKDTKHIKESVKYAAIFGGLFALVCYWQYTGQMAASAAVPSLCVLAALGGYGVGKNSK